LAAASVTLAVLSNSEASADELRVRLDRLGLAGRFRFVFSSRDVRHAKPEPACYQAALDMLRMNAGEVAHVASLQSDLTGATAVGLRAVAVNADAGVQSHCWLRRFDDLVSLCAPLAATAAR
jgi:HAD superfamily hydrolase (TIGR01509 family)